MSYDEGNEPEVYYYPERSEAVPRRDSEIDQLVAFPENLVSYDELRAAKISFVPQMVIYDDGVKYTAVSGLDLDALCRVLNITRSEIILHPTNLVGVMFGEFPDMPHRKKPTKPAPKKSSAATLRQKYMELCGEEGKAKLITQLEKEQERLQAEIDKSQQALVYNVRLSIRKRDELEQLKNDSDKFSARFGEEFDQLMKHPDVKTIEITGTTLTVYTRMIYIECSTGSVYEIGEFKIDIYADGSNGCINFKNLTRLVEDRWSHPHVNYDGRPCLGNIQDTVPQLIAERKFAALTSVLIEYLKSYESSDEYRPYRPINCWPEARKEKRDE